VNQNLTISVDSSVTAQTYALKVRATAGSITQEADLSLTVNSPDTGQVIVSVRDPEGNGYTGYFSEPGSSSWQTVSFDNGQGTFNVVGSSYGVAIVCGSGLRNIAIGFFRKDETNRPAFTCSGFGAHPPNPNAYIDIDASQIASAAGIAVGDEVLVNDSHLPAILDENFRARVSYNRATNNPVDLVTVIRSPGYTGAAKAVKIVRNVTESAASVNFSNSDLTNPITTTLVNQPPSFDIFVTYGIVTSNKTGSGGIRISNTSYFPVTEFQAGDVYASFAEAFTSNYFTGGDGERVVSFKAHSYPVTTVEFPSPWSSGALTITATPLPVVSGLSYPKAIAYGIGYYFTNQANRGSLSVLVSSGFLSGSTSFSFGDLSTLLDSVGYTLPSAGEQVSIEVAAITSTMGLEKSVEFVFAFGSPYIVSYVSSSLDIQFVNARKNYVVDHSSLVFP
jgi:hypothetical protein